jgi:hypothetical protein
MESIYSHLVCKRPVRLSFLFYMPNFNIPLRWGEGKLYMPHEYKGFTCKTMQQNHDPERCLFKTFHHKFSLTYSILAKGLPPTGETRI